MREDDAGVHTCHLVTLSLWRQGGREGPCDLFSCKCSYFLPVFYWIAGLSAR